MKTTFFSLTTILVLFYTFLAAANPTFTKEHTTYTKSDVIFSLPKEIVPLMAPATPAEATFDDADNTGTIDTTLERVFKLRPVTPKEASFDDIVPGRVGESFSLLPITPNEATFEDLTAK